MCQYRIPIHECPDGSFDAQMDAKWMDQKHAFGGDRLSGLNETTSLDRVLIAEAIGNQRMWVLDVEA